MRSTGVITRFLSMLDVTLILLGFLMIVLMHSQLRKKSQADLPTTLASIADVDFVPLYAGWKGEQNGRCYLLDNAWEIDREVRTTTAQDFRRILEERRPSASTDNLVVLLLFSEDGWYSSWPEEKLNEMERTWGTRIVPVYNVRIEPERESRR